MTQEEQNLIDEVEYDANVNLRKDEEAFHRRIHWLLIGLFWTVAFSLVLWSIANSPWISP